MNKAILYSCGVLNVLFAAFHLLLGWTIVILCTITGLLHLAALRAARAA